MKQYILWAIALLLASLTACKKQQAESNEPSFPDKQFFGDVAYGENTNWLGQQEKLVMDIYLPAEAVHSAQKFPFLMYVHGGGFVKGDKSLGASYAKQMAQRGFAVASINYRLGWTQDTINMCNGDTMQAKKAIYRALQDTRAAFRFLVANADKYGIDTAWMFLSGSSAGGVTTLFLPVVNEQNVNVLFPGFQMELGPLNTGNDLTNTFTLKGLVDMWGVISDTNLITRQNALPTLFFHGMRDRVAPYGTSHFYSCETFPISYGTEPVCQRLTHLGVSAVANIDPLGGHGVYDAVFRAANTVYFLNGVMTGRKQQGFFTDGQGNCP